MRTVLPILLIAPQTRIIKTYESGKNTASICLMSQDRPDMITWDTSIQY
jgi:hypothetical protein